MSELEAAVTAGDWPLAIDLALTIWRETRAIELAELIDAIDLRLPREPAPREKSRIKYWWLDRAMRFATADLPMLLATASSGHGGAGSWTELRERWKSLGFAALATLEKHHPGWGVYDRLEGATWLERVLALTSWPDDPRLAPVLLSWLERPPITLGVSALRSVAELLADRVSVLGDARVIPRLEAMIAEPRGALEATRTHQVDLARRVVTAIDARPATPLDPALAGEIVRCRALLAVAPPDTAKTDADIATMWRAVAADRDDLATRLVLADALVAAGDPRGDFIALQCSGVSRNAERARTLLHRHWATWLGDLALLVSRRTTVFEHGMIRATLAGTANTPPWVWAKVHGHRELQTLVELRPDVAPPDSYAELVASLPHLKTLGIDAPETIRHLAALGARLDVTRVEYKDYNLTLASTRKGFGLLEISRDLAISAPLLEELHLVHLNGPARLELDRVLPELPALFPAIRKIRVSSYNFHDQPDARARVLALPFVEIY
ncbi:MAG TPA: hypothetical protein VIU61_09310 [Kofleriaceae bacterium]